MTPRLASFMYHEVADRPADSGFQRPLAARYRVTPATFARHLNLMNGRSLPTLVSEVDFDRPGDHVLVTFDDGGRSALESAAALERRGWRGHFFIVTARLGTRTFLSRSEIRALSDAGHLIGSHSHNHPDIFTDLGAAAMLEEWRTSSAILAELTGRPCLVASVPGGDLSRTVVETAAEAGFTHLFTSEPHLRPDRIDGCWVLGRFAVRSGTPPETIEALSRFRGWNSALTVRRLKTLARRACPPLYRLYVRLATVEA